MPLVAAAGCGGKWTDDAGNFKRVFGFAQPHDVRVLHSYYWKSPHWTTEYQYFIALQAPSRFATGLTAEELMKPTSPSESDTSDCGSDRPAWFLPKGMSEYEMWAPKMNEGYRVFRDKSDGTLFVCDERL